MSIFSRGKETVGSPRRANPTQKPASKRGNIVIFKIDATPPGTWMEHVLPDNIYGGYIKNTGPASVDFRFEDDAVTNFWVLGLTEISPTGIAYPESKRLFFRAAAPTGEVTLLFW